MHPPLVRAFSVAMMPALATLIVCCSITSCSCNWIGATPGRSSSAAQRLSRPVVLDRRLGSPAENCYPAHKAVRAKTRCTQQGHTWPHHAACRIAHLVKLVNATDAFVRQHQRTALQNHLLCLWVLQVVAMPLASVELTKQVGFSQKGEISPFARKPHSRPSGRAHKWNR